MTNEEMRDRLVEALHPFCTVVVARTYADLVLPTVREIVDEEKREPGR